jgi:SNF2 family DNA or RNA helicase
MCTHLGSLALLHAPNAASSSARGGGSTAPCKPIFVVVCPATVLHHWLQEFHAWTPFLRTVVLHSISATASELLRIGGDYGT